MISAWDIIEAGYELLAGNLDEAERAFRLVLNAAPRFATPEQKYRALHGLCKVLDLRGQWIESETVFANEYRKLTQPAPRQKPAASGWIVPLALFGLAVGVVVGASVGGRRQPALAA